jgi:hypothetical protein
MTNLRNIFETESTNYNILNTTVTTQITEVLFIYSSLQKNLLCVHSTFSGFPELQKFRKSHCKIMYVPRLFVHLRTPKLKKLWQQVEWSKTKATPMPCMRFETVTLGSLDWDCVGVEHMGKMRNAHKNLIRKPLVRPKYTYRNKTEIFLMETGWGCGLDFSVLG